MLADPTGLINSFQPTNLLTKTGGRILRTTSSSRGAGGLHRSAYYSVGKGINAAKKQAISEVIAIENISEYWFIKVSKDLINLI